MNSFTLSVHEKRLTFNRPLIMGIINLSPGSFFASTPDEASALDRAQKMIEMGVDIIDIGAVATNPQINLNTDLPKRDVELATVIPFVARLSELFKGLISVDTSDPVVMIEAVNAGAHIINDQRALTEPGALDAVAQLNVPVCLMHYFRQTRKPGATDHDLPSLFNIVKSDLLADVTRCQLAGITDERIIIDPGFGGGHFGKSAIENFYLLSKLTELLECGYPVLAGFSRKSMFGDLLAIPKEERLSASIAAAVMAAMKGTHILRVHDVAETVHALRVVEVVKKCHQYEAH